MTALFLTVAVGIQVVFGPSLSTLLVDNDGPPASEMGDVDLASTMPASSLQGKWMLSFEEAAKLAARESVPLIVHFEASWCGPCRQMEGSVLNKTAVLEQLSQRYVGVRVDADHHPDLVSRFQVTSLPTEVIINDSGDELARYVGITSLDSYLARLNALAASRSASDASKSQKADSESALAESESGDDDKTRSCLIVRRDGKMVGLGGYSPVALISERTWEKGQDAYVGSFENVDYFFRSEAERDQFIESPETYIPRLHGCDPVSLYLQNRAEAGAIEFGAFYKGQVYFFASLQNRQRFQRNPEWFASILLKDYVDNPDQLPFIQSSTVE